ncbi:MAG: hypothetical protein IKV41_03540 [Oscillospiraceae bacterium]|nr:hypothetical protein [Oscillospiraceae bacterium]
MKKLFMIIAASLVMTAGSVFASAQSEQQPEPYRTTQGEYTLVISDESQESGVYKADELLYTLPDTNNISEVYLTDDGMQAAIVYDAFTGSSKESLAVAFYNNGRLTQSYTVNDLVLGFMTEEGENGTIWEDAEQRFFDLQAENLTIVCKDNSKHIFSMINGSKLYEENPMKIGVYAGGFLLAVVLFVVYWFSKYCSLRNASEELRKQDKQHECGKSKGFEEEKGE